jgi:hypothetical protein
VQSILSERWSARYYNNVREICRPGTSTEEFIAAVSVTEENGFTTYDSVFEGEAGKSPELGTRRAEHPLELWTFIENMLHVFSRTGLHGFQSKSAMAAAVVVKTGSGESLHNYHFKFRFAACKGMRFPHPNSSLFLLLSWPGSAVSRLKSRGFDHFTLTYADIILTFANGKVSGTPSFLHFNYYQYWIKRTLCAGGDHSPLGPPNGLLVSLMRF